MTFAEKDFIEAVQQLAREIIGVAGCMQQDVAWGTRVHYRATKAALKAIQISDLCRQRMNAEVLAIDLAAVQATDYDLAGLATAGPSTGIEE